jgi:hypothetical protein
MSTTSVSKPAMKWIYALAAIIVVLVFALLGGGSFIFNLWKACFLSLFLGTYDHGQPILQHQSLFWGILSLFYILICFSAATYRWRWSCIFLLAVANVLILTELFAGLEFFIDSLGNDFPPLNHAMLFGGLGAGTGGFFLLLAIGAVLKTLPKFYIVCLVAHMVLWGGWWIGLGMQWGGWAASVGFVGIIMLFSAPVWMLLSFAKWRRREET